MGGFGHHHVHPWEIQSFSFFLSLALPFAVMVLLGAERRERNARG